MNKYVNKYPFNVYVLILVTAHHLGTTDKGQILRRVLLELDDIPEENLEQAEHMFISVIPEEKVTKLLDQYFTVHEH